MSTDPTGVNSSGGIALTMSSLVGRLLGQNYRVVEPIDAGAMGMVFVVEHVNLPKRFAAKVLTPDLARHPEAIARFEVEARAVSQLEHENIVSVVDFGKTDDGCVFLVMELLRGKTLQARIDQGPLPLEEIFGIIVQVCRALAAAHASGIVHRDMKPDNVFLVHRPGGRPLVKVLDFGVSKARETSVRGGRITRHGQVLGSPEYMAPEACRGDEVDARADVYAVGIMLYQLLCGDVPFRDQSYLKVLQMHAQLVPPRPRAAAPEMPDALERVIMRALQKDPALRQSSIEELELELVSAMPDLAQRAMTASQIAPQAGWGAHPTIDVITDRMPTLAQGSVPPGATLASSDGDTLNTRRRGRGTAVVLGLLGGAIAIATVGGIALWLDRTSGRSAPTRAAKLAPAPTAEPLADEPAATPAPVAAEQPAASDVSIHVESSPPGATVTLDGKRLGRTPVDAVLRSEEREGELEIELRGYRTARRSVALNRDGELRVALQREAARKPPAPRPSSRTSGREAPSDPAESLGIKERR
jgi:eukaryotic-like serine/threonine-protein kinase